MITKYDKTASLELTISKQRERNAELHATIRDLKAKLLEAEIGLRFYAYTDAATSYFDGGVYAQMKLASIL